MWTAATSGFSYASQHHILEGMHLPKVTLYFVDLLAESGFGFKCVGLLERNRLITRFLQL